MLSLIRSVLEMIHNDGQKLHKQTLNTLTAVPFQTTSQQETENSQCQHNKVILLIHNKKTTIKNNLTNVFLSSNKKLKTSSKNFT